MGDARTDFPLLEHEVDLGSARPAELEPRRPGERNRLLVDARDPAAAAREVAAVRAVVADVDEAVAMGQLGVSPRDAIVIDDDLVLGRASE